MDSTFASALIILQLFNVSAFASSWALGAIEVATSSLFPQIFIQTTTPRLVCRGILSIQNDSAETPEGSLWLQDSTRLAMTRCVCICREWLHTVQSGRAMLTMPMQYLIASFLASVDVMACDGHEHDGQVLGAHFVP